MSPQPSPFLRKLRLAGYAFAAFFLLYLSVNYVIMPLYTQQGRTTVVPDVLGLPVDEAKTILQKAELQPYESETKPDRSYPVGTVSGQNPPSNAVVKYGRGVYLTISGGDIMVDVPNLRGRSLRDATFALERAGLKLGSVRYEPSDEIFMNTVISQSVETDRKVKSGSFVSVVVSQGKPGEKRAVPNIVGKSLSESERLLIQSGFTLGAVTLQPSSDLLPNTVMDQYPKAGELAPFGQQVDVFVAKKADVESQPAEEGDGRNK